MIGRVSGSTWNRFCLVLILAGGLAPSALAQTPGEGFSSFITNAPSTGGVGSSDLVPVIESGTTHHITGANLNAIANAAQAAADAAQSTANGRMLPDASNASASSARTNLGLGSAATHASTDFDPTGAAANAQAASLQKTSNLSDVANAATARGNIGAAASGDAAASGITLSSGTVLGRTTAGTGGVEELTTLPAGLTVPTPSIVGTSTNSTACVGCVGEFVSVTANDGGGTVTISNATPAVISGVTPPAVSLSPNPVSVVPVSFTTTGTLPTGLSPNTPYYIIPTSVSGNTFSVATTIANALAGTAVATSSSGSGTHTAQIFVPLTSTAAKSVVAINLSPGDWRCSGQAAFDPQSSGATPSEIRGGITTTLDVAPTGLGPGTARIQGSLTLNALQNLSLGPARFLLASTTPVYLGLESTYSGGTVYGVGNLNCTRQR